MPGAAGIIVQRRGAGGEGGDRPESVIGLLGLESLDSADQSDAARQMAEAGESQRSTLAGAVRGEREAECKIAGGWGNIVTTQYWLSLYWFAHSEIQSSNRVVTQ